MSAAKGKHARSESVDVCESLEDESLFGLVTEHLTMDKRYNVWSCGENLSHKMRENLSNSTLCSFIPPFCTAHTHSSQSRTVSQSLCGRTTEAHSLTHCRVIRSLFVRCSMFVLSAISTGRASHQNRNTLHIYTHTV